MLGFGRIETLKFCSDEIAAFRSRGTKAVRKT